MNFKRLFFCIFLVACQICCFASEETRFRVKDAENCIFIINGEYCDENNKKELSLKDSIIFKNKAFVKLEDRSKDPNDALRYLSFEKILGKYCLKDIVKECKTKNLKDKLISIEISMTKGFDIKAQGEKGNNKDSLMLISNIKAKIEDFYMENGLNSFSDFNNSDGIVAEYDEAENILVIKNNLDLGLYIDILCQKNGKMASCLSNGRDFVSKLWINKGKTLRLVIDAPEKAFVVGSEVAVPYNFIMRVNMDDFYIKELESEIFLQMIKIDGNKSR